MRLQFCEGLLKIFGLMPESFFLTGDLGFMALEPLREKIKERFLNVGISEQNMVGIAAGMANQGFVPWVYSIAPFIYARAFEQIRNDISLNQLPVVLVGNGGGYGYGVMGPTHHALEDYGILSTIDVTSFVPAFNSDIGEILTLILQKHKEEKKGTFYLRLGRSETQNEKHIPPFGFWRKIIYGTRGVVLGVGPLIGHFYNYFIDKDVSERPTIWVVGKIPLLTEDIPLEFFIDVERNQLYILEEHHVNGGIAQQLSLILLQNKVTPVNLVSRSAVRYPSGRYGSQDFHRKESQLDLNYYLQTFL